MFGALATAEWSSRRASFHCSGRPIFYCPYHVRWTNSLRKPASRARAASSFRTALTSTRSLPGDPDPGLIGLPQTRDRFVVGWIGGFRPFHGLEMIPEIAAQLSKRVPEAVLCLVGSGPLWKSLAARTRLAQNVVMVPAVPYSQVPDWLRTFDACLLLAPPGSFHYSPLKLREYMACGRPIVAPSIGEIPSVVSDGKEALLVPPGDVLAVVRAVERLARDRELRARLGDGARSAATRNESWDVRARGLFEAMADHGLVNVQGMS